MKYIRKIPVPLFLFILAIFTYGLFFSQRGFYWDEAPWTWIYFRLGPAALTKTFSTSRPFWGMLYQVLLPMIGPRPWAWQLLMVLMRWLGSVLLWKLLILIWPSDERPAAWSSVLFLVYPGLGQNFVALMYTHFYIILNIFLLSLIFSLLAIKKEFSKSVSTLFNVGAIFLAVINLLTMEYFYFLEFFRLVLFWFVFGDEWKIRLQKSMLRFSPYFLAFVGVTFWRAFFFSNQNASYGYGTIAAIRENFWQGIYRLISIMLGAFWESVPHAWFFPFEPVNIQTLGIYSTIAAFGLAVIFSVFSGMVLLSWGSPNTKGFSRSFFILGGIAWILGGGAFWLVGEKTMPQLHFSADRFTLSFMLGSSMMIAALAGLLKKYPRLQFGFLAILIGFSVGKQFQANSLYRHDWETQRSLFWQMSWRIPGLQPGTTLLSNDLPVTLFSDNSLSGPLNWIYSSPGRMDTILYFASVRTQEGRALGDGLVPGTPIEQNYLAATFKGNTSNMIVFNYSPPGCFRVLDPEIDAHNRLLPPILRDAASLSSSSRWILPSAVVTLPEFYSPEPPHGWCYNFSRAELARQSADWEKIIQLYKSSVSAGEKADDPMEYFVFIEAHAHQGDWQTARRLTKDAFKFSKEIMRSNLCILWQRIDREVNNSPEKINAMTMMKNDLACK